jgi:heptosyltransferase-2
MAASFRVLVKGNNWLGDAVLSLPTIGGIKLLKPHASVSVLTRESLRGLYESVGDVDEIIPYASSFDALRKLRKREFDACLILPRSFKSALVPAIARIPTRIGYAADSRSLLLTVPVPRGEETLKTHRIYYYFNLLRGFAPTPQVPRAELQVLPGAAAWVRGALEVLPTRGRSLVAMNPGGAFGESKRWGSDRFAALGRRLARELGAFVAVVGLESEAELTAEVAKRIGRDAADFGGKTSIPQLIALLARAELFVGNDTAAMHLADALGRPVAAIFGPTDPVATRPFGRRHAILRREGLECSPCLKTECPLRHHDCMRLIEVSEVFDACRKLLK